MFYRSVGERFDLAKSVLYKSFNRIVNFLNTMAPTVIKWVSAERRKVLKSAFKKRGGLEGVVGMVDGTYINISAPNIDPEAYIHRKCGYGIILQAVCDDELRFTNCFVGYPSSVSDVRIFRNSHLFKNIVEDEQKYFSDGEYILGDKAYPNKMWCIAPFIAYQPLTEFQKNFNFCHAQARQTIERAFALFFGRFRRFKYLDRHRTDLIPGTILAACVLHNLCLDVFDDNIENLIADGLDFNRTNTGRSSSPNIGIRQQLDDTAAAEYRNQIAAALPIK